MEHRKRSARKGTTTNRRGTNPSTTFSVFLLTGNLHPLILRFQIRGTWKRQSGPGRGLNGSWSAHGDPRDRQGIKRKIERELPAARPPLSAKLAVRLCDWFFTSQRQRMGVFFVFSTRRPHPRTAGILSYALLSLHQDEESMRQLLQSTNSLRRQQRGAMEF